MTTPLISVCIPVYNGEKYISNTINSVLNQTFKQFELLIVDNCSTDNTLNIVNTYSDSRIRVIKNDNNVGMVNNWNVCLRNAKADWVIILCADDVLNKNALKYKYKIATSEDNISFVFSASSIINQNNKRLYVRRPLMKSNIFAGIELAKKSFRSHNIFGEPSNILYRKEYAIELGGYTNKVVYSPDWEFCIRLATKGKIGYVNVPLTDYRISDSMATVDLINNKDFIKRDERILINEVRQISGLHLSKFDILCHEISLSFRLFEKQVFLKLVSFANVLGRRK